MKHYTLDDILLRPQYSEIRSRSDIDLTTDMGNGMELKFPIISSPRHMLTHVKMATRLACIGGLGIIHRYNSIANQAAAVRVASYDSKGGNVGAAVGATDDYVERALELEMAGANVICIDVEHGHHIMVKEALSLLRSKLKPLTHLMAGSVATRDGFESLQHWGADSIRCGIGGGTAHSTRIQTGHGVTNLRSILECKRVQGHSRIIIDDDIKNSGDMVKAIAMGADAVMVSSLLAGTDASPSMVDSDKYVGVFEDYIEQLCGGIRSGCLYSGVGKLSELHMKAHWDYISQASIAEGKPHILTKS